MFLDKYIEKVGTSTEFPIFNNKISTNVVITTNDLFLSQYKDDYFNAVDIVVKYLAIENYYGLNNYGFKLYEKMQNNRINDNWNERFVELIKNFEKNGMKNIFPIETDINYSIHDGAHRLALAMFFRINDVFVKVYNIDNTRRTYDLNWFKKNKFTDEEIIIIENKLKELLKLTRTPYYCVLWPPTRNIFQKIEKEIELVENGIELIDSEYLELNKNDFKQFMYDVYSTDDILPEKLDLKYKYLIQSLNKDNYNKEKLPLMMLKVILDNPDFKLKSFTGLPQSKKTMRIKSNIRNTNNNCITDYHYDIIMHMTDNSIQNNDVERILKKVKR